MNNVRIIATIIGMDLSSLADQVAAISSSGRWIPTRAFITNVNAAGVSANVQSFDAPGGLPTNRVSAGGSLFSISSPDDVQQYNTIFGLAGSGKAKVRTSPNLYVRTVSALPSGTTGDFYLEGIDL